MKTYSLISIIFILSLFVRAAQAQKNLQGSWRTVEFLGMPYKADDGWDFEGNIAYIVVNGQRSQLPARFKIKGKRIITDDGTDVSEAFDIIVIKFKGDSMRVKSGSQGYESVLKKRKSASIKNK